MSLPLFVEFEAEHGLEAKSTAETVSQPIDLRFG
tara:strand:+ start:459 stop:560 length:102 start_codon:yes stop_codon:yes gene_type:complete